MGPRLKSAEKKKRRMRNKERKHATASPVLSCCAHKYDGLQRPMVALVNKLGQGFCTKNLRSCTALATLAFPSPAQRKHTAQHVIVELA